MSLWRTVLVALVLGGALDARADDEAFKNVRHFKELSAFELQRTMNFMRASLGVHCDLCHVVTEKDGWQWEKDDKPAKVTARAMIAMVERLNREQFDARPVVSCYTCHRGHQRPESVPPLPQAAPVFPTVVESAAGPQPDLPSADVVWKRFQDAVHFARPPATRILKGQRTGHETQALEIQEKGERFLVAATTDRGRIEQALDGGEGWVRDAKGSRALTVNDRTRVREVAEALAFPPAAPPPDARVVGREDVEGRPAWVLAWSAGGRSVRMSFDVETSLLVRKETLAPGSIGVVPERIDYRDYRDVGRARMPGTFITAYVDPWTSSTRTFAEIELDAPVDDAVFVRR